MKYVITFPMTCNNGQACSLSLQTKLETALGIKLHADNETDTVNGSITIHHVQNAHKITIEIYERDEQPNKFHNSTLKRPALMPTKQALEALL